MITALEQLVAKKTLLDKQKAGNLKCMSITCYQGDIKSEAEPYSRFEYDVVAIQFKYHSVTDLKLVSELLKHPS